MFSSSFATRFLAPALLALGALSSAVRAQALVDTLSQPDSVGPLPGFFGGSRFGTSVAMSGEYALVGEPGFRVTGLGQAGRIVLYRRDAQGHWQHRNTFTGDIANAQLGASVAVATPAAGEITLLAGAPGTGSARAYVYLENIDTWSVASLTPPVSTPGGDFGWSVATNGLDFVVGQPHREGGYVHFYRRSAGGQFVGPWSSVFEVSVGGAAGEYGYSVALTSDRLVVGAPSFVEIDGFHPECFVYRKTSGGNWTFENVLSWPFFAGTYSHGFGKSVAIDGSRIVVGAPDTTVNGFAGVGRAVSFTRSGTNWTQERVYHDLAFTLNHHFGAAVAVNGTAVAASRFSAASPLVQYVVIFDATTGGVVRTVNPPLASYVGHEYGTSIALGASQILVGDPAHDGEHGVAYANLWTGPDCNGNGQGDPSDIFRGDSADVNADGIPDDCETPVCQLEKFVPSNAVANDQLGTATATDGTRVITAALHRTGPGGTVNAGVAYVQRRDGTHLTFEAQLPNPNPHNDDYFGHAVAIDGDLAFVGSPGDDLFSNSAGAVYVFRRNPSTGVWLFDVRIPSPEVASGMNFGAALAFTPDFGGTLLVGATGNGSTQVGRVNVFRRSGNTWTPISTFFEWGPDLGSAYGASVAVHGSLVAIGAPYADRSAADTGAVYYGTLAASMPSAIATVELTPVFAQLGGSRLGSSVAVSPSGRIAAGAPGDPYAGFIAGSVSVFEPLASPAFTFFALRLAGANDWDSFGTSVAWAGERLVVGVPFIDTPQALGAGMCVTYQIDAVAHRFIENSRAWTSDGNINQAFGQSVAWANGLLAVGAYGDDTASGVDTGSVYALGLAGADCNSNLACDLCDIRAGTLADIGGNGVPDVCELSLFCFGDGSGAPCPCGNTAPAQSGGCKHSFGLAGRLDYAGTPSVANDTFVFTASDLPATSTALFFQGTGAENQGAGATFADGVRCVTGSLVRLRTRVASAGVATYPIAGDPLVHVRGSCVPGDTRYYQVNYRNSASTFCTSATMNYTNGVAAVWQP